MGNSVGLYDHGFGLCGHISDPKMVFPNAVLAAADSRNIREKAVDILVVFQYHHTIPLGGRVSGGEKSCKRSI
jgi:hypothetical protein